MGARVKTLHRKQAGPFTDTASLDIEQLEDERGEERAEILDYHLLPMDSPVESLAKIELSDDSGYYFMQGQAVMDLEVYQIGAEGDTVRVFEESGRFLGLAEITDDGRIAPKRLVVY